MTTLAPPSGPEAAAARELVTELERRVGLAIADAAVLYGPALKRMTMAELTAYVQAIGARDADAALAAVHAKMSLAELAAEKEGLAALTKARAEANAEARAIFQAVFAKILEAALSVLLTAVCL